MADIKFVGAGQMADLNAALRNVSDEVADLVLSLLEDKARQIATKAGAKVPYRTGKARASYKARGAAIVIGEGVPYVPWLEFGGTVGRKAAGGAKGTVKRPYAPKGRYLYPTIAAEAADIEKYIDDLIAQASNGYLVVE